MWGCRGHEWDVEEVSMMSRRRAGCRGGEQNVEEGGRGRRVSAKVLSAK